MSAIVEKKFDELINTQMGQWTIVIIYPELWAQILACK